MNHERTSERIPGLLVLYRFHFLRILNNSDLLEVNFLFRELEMKYIMLINSEEIASDANEMLTRSGKVNKRV